LFIYFSVPGRKPGKFLGQDMLPSIILHGYYYRYKVRSKSEILCGAKRRQNDEAQAGASKKKVGNMRQVYCVTKKKFFATATPEEMKRQLRFNESKDKEDLEDLHRILQCRLRSEKFSKFRSMAYFEPHLHKYRYLLENNADSIANFLVNTF
jgi:hypothetical protein